MKFHDDSTIRAIYLRAKARAHGWPEVLALPMNPDGKFINDDDETAYQRFAAGFKASFDGTLLDQYELYWSTMEAATALAQMGEAPFMIGLQGTDKHLAIGDKKSIIQFAAQDRIVTHNADQVEAVANGTLPVDPAVVNEMLLAYAKLLKAK